MIPSPKTKDGQNARLRMAMAGEHHKPECTIWFCYCYDDVMGDPMCNCGRAACFCKCNHDDDFDVPGYAHPWDGEPASNGESK